jgi:hypothetical protein
MIALGFHQWWQHFCQSRAGVWMQRASRAKARLAAILVQVAPDDDHTMGDRR